VGGAVIEEEGVAIATMIMASETSEASTTTMHMTEAGID
jgi:hypothetical protein